MVRREEMIGTVVRYHERTEHRLPDRFAPSLGYLDWDTQPDPFRRYRGADLIELPLVEPSESEGPSWSAARSTDGIAPVPVDRNSLSQLLYDSMAISAWKQQGTSRWALRCNPSSGNLHPTEAYVIAGPVAQLTTAPALLHYAPHRHGVVVRRRLDPDAIEALTRQLPEDSLVIGLSTVMWREAWKYGERAFRYCMHDVGHAVQALALAARMMGWRARRIEGLDSSQLNRLLALDEIDGPEAERADLLLAIETAPTEMEGPARVALSEAEIERLCPLASGAPNRLSSEHHDWPTLEEVELATREMGESHGELDRPRTGSAPFDDALRSPSARVLARKRRSAVDFDGRTEMTLPQFYRALATLVPAITPSLWTAFPHAPRVHPLIFVHRVRGLEPCLAILVRNPQDQAALQSALSRVEEWERFPDCPNELPLFRIGGGDGRRVAKMAHCHQNIASDGAFVVSMIAAFDREVERLGAAAYRYLHWEAGAIGHLLYLEAEAASLSATGIGCFFDEAIHQLVGIEDGRFRMLYGTAVGRAVVDARVQTLPAYVHRQR